MPTTQTSRLTAAVLLCLAPALSRAASGPRVSDAQIFGILSAANAGEIGNAKLARDRASDKAVKRFADEMIRDHDRMQTEGNKLAGKLKMTPEDSAESNELKQGSQETLTKLEGLNGPAFDQAYAEAAVADHRKVLATIDNTLIPAAQNKELRAMLHKARKTIAEHLQHAKHLQEQLKKNGGRSAQR